MSATYFHSQSVPAPAGASGPDPRVIARIKALAQQRRRDRPWGPQLAAMRASGIPMCAEDDDDDADDDDDDDADDDTDDDAGKTKPRSKAKDTPTRRPAKKKATADADDDADDDTDTDDDDDDHVQRELREAKRRAAEAERRAKRAERKLSRRERQDAEDQGEYKELYEQEKTRADKAEAKLRDGAVDREVQRIANDMKAKNPARIRRLLDLPDDVVDEDGEVDTRAIEKAIKDLRKSDKYLFRGDDGHQSADLNGDTTAAGTRRRRRASTDDDVRGPSRIRRAYESTAP
jgi:hypothetical protein